MPASCGGRIKKKFPRLSRTRNAGQCTHVAAPPNPTPVSPRGRIQTEIPKFPWPWPAHWSSGSNAESAVRKVPIAATTEHGERPNTQQANGVQVWHVAIGSMTQRPTTRQRAASPRPRPCVVRRRGVSWRGGTPQWVVDYNSGTDRRCGSRSARRTRGSSPTTKHTRS